MLSAPAANGTFSTLFCESFLRCLSPYHGGPTECTCLVLPQCLRPSPCRCRVGFPLLSANAIFRGEGFRGCSYFVMFRPPSWLASRIAPTAAGFPAGQLRRLRPSRTCVVAFARIGYARRPTTGNWRHEDFHLARFTALSTAPPAAFPKRNLHCAKVFGTDRFCHRSRRLISLCRHLLFEDQRCAVLIEAVRNTARRCDGTDRSEEHTSELQSRLHLVCRLLLEKKK